MARDIYQAVRESCLWLPEAEEFVSHGSPNFRVRGKTFATYAVNHHGDGRVALWLNAMPGSQELLTRAEPDHFFVPPYVGPRGWLGVILDRGIDWNRIPALVREAYEKVAPGALLARVGKTMPKIKPPARGAVGERGRSVQVLACARRARETASGVPGLAGVNRRQAVRSPGVARR